MRDEQDFFQIEIMDGKTVYACNICDEGFEHMKEIEEHVVISHKDKLNFVSVKEADENVVHESKEDVETHNVIFTKEMKENLLKEIDDLCNDDSSESSDTDSESD